MTEQRDRIPDYATQPFVRRRTNITRPTTQLVGLLILGSALMFVVSARYEELLRRYEVILIARFWLYAVFPLGCVWSIRGTCARRCREPLASLPGDFQS